MFEDVTGRSARKRTSWTVKRPVPSRFRQLSEGATLPLAAFGSDTGSLWCRSVGWMVQVSKPNGAVQKDGWRRSVSPTGQVRRMDGAGPILPYRPAPGIAILSVLAAQDPTVKTDLRHWAYRPAPLTSLTCTVDPKGPQNKKELPINKKKSLPRGKGFREGGNVGRSCEALALCVSAT